MCVQQRIQPWHRAAVAWASGLKAPVLALDPPPEIPVLVPRFCLKGPCMRFKEEHMLLK